MWDEITDRLRRLVTVAEGRRAAARTEQNQALAGASDDEMFAFIGKEFGIS
jgi:hypothetical protein